METFNYTVVLKVEVEAFSSEDAQDLLRDVFGTGSDGDIYVVDFEAVEQDY